MTDTVARKPFTIPIEPGEGFQRLLPGEPSTCGMKSGRVSLAEGEECGWHSTKRFEETLVVLEGRGKGVTRGDPDREMTFEAPCVVYIPPHTEHNMIAIGPGPLRYVYTVAPTG